MFLFKLDLKGKELDCWFSLEYLIWDLLSEMTVSLAKLKRLEIFHGADLLKTLCIKIGLNQRKLIVGLLEETKTETVGRSIRCQMYKP